MKEKETGVKNLIKFTTRVAERKTPVTKVTRKKQAFSNRLAKSFLSRMPSSRMDTFNEESDESDDAASGGRSSLEIVSSVPREEAPPRLKKKSSLLQKFGESLSSTTL